MFLLLLVIILFLIMLLLVVVVVVVYCRCMRGCWRILCFRRMSLGKEYSAKWMGPESSKSR